MIAHWFSTHPPAAAIATFALMLGDWLLTVWQQHERATRGSDHTRTYPLDTIEGNPGLRDAVQHRRWFSPRHLAASGLVSAAVFGAMVLAPPPWRTPILGYVWGLFMIVDSTHVGNLVGYRVCRRGTHGLLWLHQRTAHLVQAGRYAALALLLIALALLSGSPFMAGVAVAGVSTVIRQFAWLRRVPAIAAPDAPPAAVREPADGAP